MDDEGTGDPEVDGYYGVDVGARCSSPDVVIIGKDGKPQKPAAPVAGCEPDPPLELTELHFSDLRRHTVTDRCAVVGLDLGEGCGKSFNDAVTGLAKEVKERKPGPATLGVAEAVLDAFPVTRGILGNPEPPTQNVLKFERSW